MRAHSLELRLAQWRGASTRRLAPHAKLITLRRFAGPLLVSAPLLFSTACATSSTQTEVELSQLRRELHGLRTELAETKAELVKVEGRVTLLSVGQKEEPASKPATSAARDNAAATPPPPAARRVPNLPVVRLPGEPAKPASTPGSQDQDPGALDDGGPPILIKVGPGESSDKLEVDHEVLKKKDPVLGDVLPPSRKIDKSERKKAIKTDYEAALAMLRDQKKPGEARARFEAFRARYPDSDLADNAAYWLAECSFAERQSARALEEYLKVIAEYPGSPKVPDAMLRVSHIYSELGDRTKAGDMLRRIKESFPETEAATEADKALRAISETKR